jgi:hypothetical protein
MTGVVRNHDSPCQQTCRVGYLNSFSRCFTIMSPYLKAFQKISILAENCVISVIAGSICLPPKLVGWIPGRTLRDSSIIFQ